MKARSAALPLPLPKPIYGFATNARNFHFQGRCETWQFCSLQGELQPLQNANKQMQINPKKLVFSVHILAFASN